MSIDILSLMLSEHSHCPDLLERILPSTLKSKMATYRQKKREGWTAWRNFFRVVFPTDLNNPKEQWHNEIRRELTFKLAVEIR